MDEEEDRQSSAQDLADRRWRWWSTIGTYLDLIVRITAILLRR